MITITNLRYKNYLKPVNATITKGSFVGIVGPNGSGKSTLLKCIAGIYTPCEGTLFTNERLLNIKDVGYLAQEPKMLTFEALSVLENFKLANADPNLLADVGLHSNLLSKKMDHLSGGQKQRVALLMVLNAEVEVLLLDEHTSALDEESSKTVMEYTYKIAKNRGVTTFMVSHDKGDVEKYCDIVICLG